MPTTEEKVPPLAVGRLEAARAIGVSVRKIDSLLARGEITPVRIDGRVFIAWSELQRFIEVKQRKRAQIAEEIARTA